jgi:hypothetical protein
LSDRHRHRRPWGLATELKHATEHVVGPQAAMIAISIGPRMTAPPAPPKSAMPPMPSTAGRASSW